VVVVDRDRGDVFRRDLHNHDASVTASACAKVLVRAEVQTARTGIVTVLVTLIARERRAVADHVADFPGTAPGMDRVVVVADVLIGEEAAVRRDRQETGLQEQEDVVASGNVRVLRDAVEEHRQRTNVETFLVEGEDPLGDDAVDLLAVEADFVVGDLHTFDDVLRRERLDVDEVEQILDPAIDGVVTGLLPLLDVRHLLANGVVVDVILADDPGASGGEKGDTLGRDDDGEHCGSLLRGVRLRLLQ
jgi:hypothetical protein